MLYNYINGLFESLEPFDQVIHIRKDQLKAIKSLEIYYDIDIEVQVKMVNLGFNFSLASKYDFANIRSLCKIL